MAQLLTDCTVIPIGEDELIPTDSFLPAHFWESTNEVDIPASVLEEVDFWTSCLVWQRLRKGNFGVIVVVVCYTAGEEISAMDIESNGTLQ